MNGPWWAMLTVWVVVNLVDLLQTAGFLARIQLGMERGLAVNHVLGYAIAALAIPATFALVAFVRAGSRPLLIAGPAVFDAFVVFMLAVDHLWHVEWRSPPVPAIMVPYLVLFFGGIVLMGMPTFAVNRRLWLVTATTATVLIGSMGWAMRRGVG